VTDGTLDLHAWMDAKLKERPSLANGSFATAKMALVSAAVQELGVSEWEASGPAAMALKRWDNAKKAAANAVPPDVKRKPGRPSSKGVQAAPDADDEGVLASYVPISIYATLEERHVAARLNTGMGLQGLAQGSNAYKQMQEAMVSLA